MPDDIFRMVVTAAVVLACVAFVVQAGVVIALYRAIQQMQERAFPLFDRSALVMGKLGPLIDDLAPVLEGAGPVMEKIGPAVDKAGAVLTSASQILDEARPRIAELSGQAVEIAKTTRQEVERVGDLLRDAAERARMRLEQIDHSVESTVGQVEQMGETMRRAVTRPVREVNGLAAGISAAVSTLVHVRKSSVDSATQDEEMFI